MAPRARGGKEHTLAGEITYVGDGGANRSRKERTLKTAVIKETDTPPSSINGNSGRRSSGGGRRSPRTSLFERDRRGGISLIQRVQAGYLDPEDGEGC